MQTRSEPVQKRQRLQGPESSAIVNPLEATLALKQWSDALQRRQNASSSNEAGVVLSSDDVKLLVSTLNSAYDQLESGPVTRGEVIDLLEGRRRQKPSVKSAPKPASPQQAHFSTALPADVLNTIFDFVRDFHVSSPQPGPKSTKERNAWLQMLTFAKVCRSWREVAVARYSRELHSTVRGLEPHTRIYRARPKVADRVTRLSIEINDYDISLNVRNADSGFALPDLIKLFPNLVHLSVGYPTPDERYVGSMSLRDNAESINEINNWTGGVRLPSLIRSNLKNLRYLSYSFPCPLDQAFAFASGALPDLKTLDLPCATIELGRRALFSPVTGHLSRLWAPSSVLRVDELATLVGNSRIVALAATIDIDGVLPLSSMNRQPRPVTDADLEAAAGAGGGEAQAPNGAEDEKRKLVELFTKIGPHLRELHIATPFADSTKRIRHGVNRADVLGDAMRNLFNGALAQAAFPPAGNGAAAAQAGPRPAQAAQADAPAAGPQPQQRNTAAPAAADGARQQQPQQQQQFPQGQLPLDQLGQGQGLPVGFGVIQLQFDVAMPRGGAGRRNGGRQAAGGEARGDNENEDDENDNDEDDRDDDRDDNIFGAFPPFLGLGGGAINPGETQPAVLPWFEEVVACCPNLWRLELFGRRYDVSLMELISTMPIEELVLTLPVENEERRVIEYIRNALLKRSDKREFDKSKSFASLGSVVLNGRSGTWKTVLRKSLKDVCTQRNITYESRETTSSI